MVRRFIGCYHDHYTTTRRRVEPYSCLSHKECQNIHHSATAPMIYVERICLDCGRQWPVYNFPDPNTRLG